MTAKMVVDYDYRCLVTSKEAVGNSWEILNAILGHKY